MTADPVMPPELIVTPRTTPFDLSAWDIPHPNPFVCDIRIGPGQVSEVIAHVSNIEYVRWLDHVAMLHADSLGYARSTLLEQDRMWFVARHEIDYLAECWPGDELVMVTWVRDMRRVRSWRDYRLIRPADETLVCTAATLWVLVELSTRRPVRHTSEMGEAFQPLDTLSTGDP